MKRAYTHISAFVRVFAVVTAGAIGGIKSSAATIYVSGPSTNASPLRFKAIAAGNWHSLAVQSNGTAVAWGEDYLGQVPAPDGLSGVIAVAGGDGHSLALKSDGTVAAWGDTYYSESTVPSGLSSVVGIAAGELHSLAVKSDGTVVGWGAGQPGTPIDDNNYGQALVPGYVTGVVAVAAGYAHNLALKSNGTVIAWGTNFYGATTVPAGLSNVVAIAAGRYHSLALKSDGTIVAWGDNRFGQTAVPSGLNHLIAISANIYNSVALKSDGTVVTWGYPLNLNPVPDLSGAVAISAGGSHGLALRSDGTLAAWGDNSFGQTDIPGASTTDHNIQDAVNAAQDGDTVLVAPGDYVVTNQVLVTNAIRLQSTGGRSQTYLTGKGGTGTWCLAISNSLAVAEGFSFRPATPDRGYPGGAILVGGTIQNCTFGNFFVGKPGGAIVVSGGGVSNTIVTYRRYGGGFDAAAVYGDGALITDCMVVGIENPGAGMGVSLTNSRLQNSVISGVIVGGNFSDGAAVFAQSSSVVGCTISNNFNLGSGGGAYLQDSFMDRCIVSGNTGTGECIGSGGGGIFETNSVIRNSLIVSNNLTFNSGDPSCGNYGGGVYMRGGSLVNCTVVGNSARVISNGTGGGGGVFAEQNADIINSIIYFNWAGSVSSNWFHNAHITLYNSCSAPDPNEAGPGNITDDPQFVDMSNGNYHLSPSSPCIGIGMVQPWMAEAQDLDGNPRTTNGRVDMGAYQFQPLSILSITRSISNIVLRWPSAGTSELVLQRSSNLTAPESWTPNTATVTDDGTNKIVTIPATNNAQFFRLH